MAKKIRAKPLLPFWLRIPLGLACWLLLGWGFFLWLAPKLDTPNALFSVCILDDARPQLVHFAEPAQWQNKPLCREPLYFEENDGLHRIYLERDGDALYVREFADSMSDPLEFSYRIDDSTWLPTVTPLWWRHAATLKKMVSAVYAIPFAVMLYRILRRVISRRFFRKGDSHESANAIY